MRLTRAISTPAEQRSRLLEALLILVGAIAVACLILIPQAALLAIVGCAPLGFVAVVTNVLRGRIDGLVSCWAAFFPLTYFLSFPREHPIVTPQRLIVLGAFIGLSFVKPSSLMAIPRVLSRAGFVCLGFIAVAGITLAKSPEVFGPAHILVDGFLLPILFGWYIIARFDARRQLSALHTAVCISSIICAAVASAEIVTGEDLLPYEGAAMFFTGGIPRPNGPFGSNDALALVGALSLFFLLFLRAALGPCLSAGRRVLHSIGLVAAIGMALMPMFRSVVITLLLTLIIDTFWERGTTGRAWRVVLVVTLVGLIFVASIFAPNTFEDRSSSQNVYGRMAQHEQSLRVFMNHPWLGVGFNNFNNVVTGEPRYLASYQGVSSVDSPHSNLAAVLAETGIFGFVPYVITHVLLLCAILQLRHLSGSGRLVVRYYVYMFLAYWITGLTESTGLNHFVNLWYVFLITVCYKYGLTAPSAILPQEAQVPDQASSAPARILSPLYLR